jgi:hypothetical protein
MINLLIALISLFVIGFLAYRIWQIERKNIFWWALGFKLVCGILIGLMYQYYYTAGDTWTYYQESKNVIESLREHPDQLINFFWFDEIPIGTKNIDNSPRSLYFIKWVSFFQLLNGNNYWITSIYFSFISFLGSWYLVRILIKRLPHVKLESIIAVLFIPSITVWGSGVIKESIAIGFLFLLSGIFVDWYFTKRITILKFIYILIACSILWNVKYYWLAVWLAVVIPLITVHILETRVQWVRQNHKMSWLIFFMISISGISIIHPNFYFYRLFSVISENYYAYLTLSHPEDVIHFYKLDSGFWSIVINSPWALISGLFRPFIFEVATVLQAAAAIENLVLLILLSISLYRFRNFSNEINLLHLTVLFYVVFLCVFLALSTPNFGTLSRYRIGFTPFLLLLLLGGSGILSRYRNSS